jgi:hypothetical protein
MAQRDLVDTGLITDVEAMASVAELIARQPGMNPDRFFTLFGRTLAGNTPSRVRALTTKPLVESFGQVGFRSGFVEDFERLGFANNQVRHFVGSAVAGYAWGGLRGTIAVWGRDPFALPDLTLGLTGVVLGSGIRDGTILLEDVGPWIRLNVGEMHWEPVFAPLPYP